MLRLTPAIHSALRAEASRAGVSLNSLCQGVLERHVAGKDWYTIPMKDDGGLIAQIRDFLGEPLLGVVLFGSVARGAARRESDVDLLIVLDANQEVTRRLYSLWDERFSESALSPHFVRLPLRAEDAGSVWLEASVDGVVLLDRDSRIARILADIRRMTADGRLSRRSAYGLPYWVRGAKEDSHVQ